MWRCICICGQKRLVSGRNLTRDKTTSCGCRQREMAAKHCISMGRANIVHGHARHGERSPDWQSWRGMLKRCTDPNHTYYKHYGGANPPVRVCRHWMTFENFLADMGKRPAGTTLSRFADTGDYKKPNCAWHSQVQQRAEAAKKRASRMMQSSAEPLPTAA